jgi:hypothetical protein
MQGQTAKLLSHSVISAHPPDPVHYEKSIGNFTSTSYPSFFLGTSYEGYIFDTQTGTNCSIGIPSFYYERSKPFTYPGDKYAGLIASLATNTSFLANPLNWGGSLCGDWPMQVINANEGAHELHLADLDGDGKLDVVASGLAAYGFSTGFLSFQNTSSSWTLGTFIPPVGESIDVLAVNGGARTNFVACNPNNNSLYWYQNPGGSAARGKGWTAHLIASTSISGQPACERGVSLGSLHVGNRDIVLVASNETDNGLAWTPGLGYFDPGSNPNGLWTFHQIDSTYRDVHEIATDVLNGTPFFTVGEQEQASTVCNGMGYNDHGNSYSGCRVAIFAWNGTGFNVPTLISNLGSHSQTLYQLNGIEYMAGANHGGYIATDPAYNLWTFNFSSGSGGGGGGTPLTAGNYNIKDPNTGDTMDLGWALNPQWGNNGPYVYLYNYNNGSSQQITFTSSGQLQSVQNPGEFFYNNGNALAVRSSGDTFSITASGNGYTIQDKTAGGLYVNTASVIDPPNKLSLSSTPTIWMFSALSTGGGGGGGASLPSGKYNFQDGFGNTIDLGWGLHPEWGFGTYVYLYSYNNGTSQQIVFTSSGQLQSVANTSQFVTNSGGFLSLGTTGDVFTITASGNGYTILDKTVGLYVNTPGAIDPPNKLALSSTPTVWMAKPQQ